MLINALFLGMDIGFNLLRVACVVMAMMTSTCFNTFVPPSEAALIMHNYSSISSGHFSSCRQDRLEIVNRSLGPRKRFLNHCGM